MLNDKRFEVDESSYPGKLAKARSADAVTVSRARMNPYCFVGDDLADVLAAEAHSGMISHIRLQPQQASPGRHRVHPPLYLVPSIEQTPWLHNSSEHRKYEDDILKEELGPMYIGVPSFYETYFGEVPGLEPAATAVEVQGRGYTTVSRGRLAGPARKCEGFAAPNKAARLLVLLQGRRLIISLHISVLGHTSPPNDGRPHLDLPMCHPLKERSICDDVMRHGSELRAFSEGVETRMGLRTRKLSRTTKTILRETPTIIVVSSVLLLGYTMRRVLHIDLMGYQRFWTND
ncbi:hypothetical protein MKZ38_001065 [Zalerion maritima]|uniref:Uncharacterized protein n=1 Tax=Zalerion maritima TaxID=339359 RepID=A0AAD5WML4_9PEZI|nr:hypothetical protein MKZ38_001065 [Zalerion maritima]